MKNIYAQLFLTFAKIGSFTFGGGIAMLPMLSTYMGHKSVSATSRYLLLTAEVYPELLSTIEEKCAFVIPEVQNEEI